MMKMFILAYCHSNMMVQNLYARFYVFDIGWFCWQQLWKLNVPETTDDEEFVFVPFSKLEPENDEASSDHMNGTMVKIPSK